MSVCARQEVLLICTADNKNVILASRPLTRLTPIVLSGGALPHSALGLVSVLLPPVFCVLLAFDPCLLSVFGAGTAFDGALCKAFPERPLPY